MKPIKENIASFELRLQVGRWRIFRPVGAHWWVKNEVGSKVYYTLYPAILMLLDRS